MAITICRKTPVQLTAQGNDTDLLEMVGLLSPSKPVASPASEKVYHLYPGDHVIIVNDKFPWIEHYHSGNTGVIIRVIGAPQVPMADPVRDCLYRVLLDDAPMPGRPEVTLSRWEMELK